MMIQLGITQRPPIERRQATGDYSESGGQRHPGVG